MQIIIFSIVLVSILALIIGIFLGVSSELLKVSVDKKVAKIRECLPGNNCGACGYAGCDALAEAISKGEAEVNKCTVGGEKVASKISKIIGGSYSKAAKQVAFVHCDGTCVNAKNAYNYNGPKDCRIIANLPNAGEKMCTNACLGYGSCVEVCKFDAIHIVDKVAKVDEEKCVACKACINICPMKVIDLVPYRKKVKVVCSNKDIGKIAMKVCNVSCIGCGMCEKTCSKSAIKVINNVAVMDYTKCNDCGDCAKKCPRKCISSAEA